MSGQGQGSEQSNLRTRKVAGQSRKVTQRCLQLDRRERKGQTSRGGFGLHLLCIWKQGRADECAQGGVCSSPHQGIQDSSEQKRKSKGRALQKAHVICPNGLLAGRQPPAECRAEKKGSKP